MSDDERTIYEESKWGATARCSCKHWSGGGILLLLVEQAQEHLKGGDDCKVTIVFDYTPDPHIVSLEGEELPWSWES